MVSGGVTPLISATKAEKMGYRLVIWPCFGMTAAYLACQTVAKELRETGIVQDRRDRAGNTIGGVRDFFALCGLEQCVEFDAKCGGDGFVDGV